MNIKSFNTEGVLVIANMTQCKAYYSDKEFNYDYPGGLSKLILNGFVHIITTQETVQNLNFIFDKTAIDLDKWKHNGAYNYLNVIEGDKVLLVPHGTFTRICSTWNESEKITDKDVEQFEFLKEILAMQNKEVSITLDSVLATRLKIRKEEEEQLYKQCPQIDLPAGLSKVNVYTKKAQGIIFSFTAIDIIDLDKITLEPFEQFS